VERGIESCGSWLSATLQETNAKPLKPGGTGEAEERNQFSHSTTLAMPIVFSVSPRLRGEIFAFLILAIFGISAVLAILNGYRPLVMEVFYHDEMKGMRAGC
jgi:hypothetical protein